MVIASARNAVKRGDDARAQELLSEASAMAERNIGSLRDEIIGLGPYAMDELTLDVAIEKCAPMWSKRYGVKLELDLDRLDLTNELCGSLFGIAQEAVANAGRHSGAETVTVSLHTSSSVVELTVADDGHGFTDTPLFTPDDPGHIGLATMRERAELADGVLNIQTGDAGTVVIARVPYIPGNSAVDAPGPEPDTSGAH
jgi:signal transduction histidine kinase